MIWVFRKPPPMCFLLSQFPCQFFWMCSTIFDITALQMVLLGPWFYFPLILLLSFISLLSPFPLLELLACASHALQVVVRNSCISSSGRLLGLGTITDLFTSLSTYCIYLVSDYDYIYVTWYRILSCPWQLYFIMKNRMNEERWQNPPWLTCVCGCMLKPEVDIQCLPWFLSKFIYWSRFFVFAKHEYKYQFWLVLIVRLFEGFCSCLLIAGITGRHHIRLLDFHLGSWIRVVVLIFALWELYPQNYFHSPYLKENLGNAKAKKYFPTKRHSKWGNVSAF